MKKKRKNLIVFLLLTVAFAAVALYPFVSQAVTAALQQRESRSYAERNEAMDEQEALRIFTSAERYNESIAQRRESFFPPTFQSAGSEAQLSGDSTYAAQLNPYGSGIMAILRIPKIELELPVYHGTTKAVLNKGAGHVFGSSLPVGGESSNACIAAHRGLPSARMFLRLDELNEGDVLSLTVLDRVLWYEVEASAIVTPDDTRLMELSPGRDLVTLITCTPYGVNSHRLLVTAHRIEAPAEETSGQMTAGKADLRWLWVVLAVVVLAGAALLPAGKKSGKRREKRKH